MGDARLRRDVNRSPPFSSSRAPRPRTPLTPARPRVAAATAHAAAPRNAFSSRDPTTLDSPPGASPPGDSQGESPSPRSASEGDAPYPLASFPSSGSAPGWFSSSSESPPNLSLARGERMSNAVWGVEGDNAGVDGASSGRCTTTPSRNPPNGSSAGGKNAASVNATPCRNSAGLASSDKKRERFSAPSTAANTSRAVERIARRSSSSSSFDAVIRDGRLREAFGSLRGEFGSPGVSANVNAASAPPTRWARPPRPSVRASHRPRASLRPRRDVPLSRKRFGSTRRQTRSFARARLSTPSNALPVAPYEATRAVNPPREISVRASHRHGDSNVPSPAKSTGMGNRPASGSSPENSGAAPSSSSPCAKKSNHATVRSSDAPNASPSCSALARAYRKLRL